MRIDTPRLIIRSFSVSDIPSYAQIVADPRVTKYLADGEPHSFEEAREYVLDCIARDQATGIARYAVALRQSKGELIGFCGFKDVGGYVDFGWRYSHAAWGQGYGKEAAMAVFEFGLQNLKLTNMSAGAFVANTTSLKIIRRLGFPHVVEGQHNGRGTVRYYQTAVA